MELGIADRLCADQACLNQFAVGQGGEGMEGRGGLVCPNGRGAEQQGSPEAQTMNSACLRWCTVQNYEASFPFL